MRSSTLIVALAAALTVTPVLARDTNDPLDMIFARSSDVAVFGDAPYGTTPSDTAQFKVFPAFIDSINTDTDVSLVLMVGDIHSGKQFCTLSYDQSIYDMWTAFQDPLVYTPGDNEWTDCHKVAQGGGLYNAATGKIDFQVDASGNLIDYAGGNPAANLDLVRSIFFSDPGFTLGERRLVLSQRFVHDHRGHPSDANYPENVIFVKSRVLFVTLNVPGGSNNDQDIWYKAPTMSPEQARDVAERTAADIRWIDTAFALATLLRVDGVVIESQADMWDLDGTAPGAPGEAAPHLKGFEGIIAEVAVKTKALRKPVLMFNGDSHIYRSDNPLAEGAPCMTEPSSGAPAVACANDDWLSHPFYNVPNFHRVVVHGSTFPLEWLKLQIDPRSNAPAGASAIGPFSWTRMTQTP